MKLRIHVALLATLIAASAAAQDVSVFSTTIAQAYKENTPGFGEQSLSSATEFLGIDVRKLGGSEGLSLHLYGWGLQDFGDSTLASGAKNAGDLTYGYLDYRFATGNGQIKIGRFNTNLTGVNESVDGISASTDLRGGFNFSVFAGAPVLFKPVDATASAAYKYQMDFVMGARLGWRFFRNDEIGVSFLQDGSAAPQNATDPLYTRKQLGVDLHVLPVSFLDLTGHTLFNEATIPAGATAAENSRIAEHDYKATAKVTDTLSLSGTYTERNFYNYFAGSTLPNLFNQNELGFFTASGAKAAWTPIAGLQLTADVRRMERDAFGVSTRGGGDFRYNLANAHLLFGAGYHQVNAYATVSVDPAMPSYSLTHSEGRAWLMLQAGPMSFSLDGIRYKYRDAQINPNLNGKNVESAIAGSIGYQAFNSLKVSADLTEEQTPLYTKHIMGLLRIEYRFGMPGQGGN